MLTIPISKRLAAVLVFLATAFLLWRSLPSTTTSLTSASANLHPIEQLQDAAISQHNALLSRQSTDLPSAITAYQARYHISPPPGFDAWFQRAQELNSPIIDDFGSINTDLAPFRGYYRAQRDLHLPKGYEETLFHEKILEACVGDGNITFAGFQEPWFRDTVGMLFEEVKGRVPRTCLLINELDEARVLLNPAALEAETETETEAEPPSLDFDLVEDHRDLWSEVSRPCPPPEPASAPPTRLSTTLSNFRNRLSSPTSPRLDTSKFASNWTQATDLCALTPPIHYSLITSPTSARLTHARLPIVSMSKLSTFADVLFPSIWRYAEVPQIPDPPASSSSSSPDDPPAPQELDDPPWSSKSPSIYWRGSTTGGFATLENWRSLHRQSLILNMTSALPVENIDVAFTDIIQCAEPACDAQRAALPTGQRELRASGATHKILLDIDGNGLSGRLYDLLRSSSAVLRYSLQREWHDERLQPWLHFVPLSNNASEMEEIVAFLLGTQRGDEVLRVVAEEGRKWAERSLRDEDVMLYAWRLVLEMARERWDGEGMKNDENIAP